MCPHSVPMKCYFKTKHRKSLQESLYNKCLPFSFLGIAGHQGGPTLYSHGQQAAPVRKPTGGHRKASGGIL